MEKTSVIFLDLTTDRLGALWGDDLHHLFNRRAARGPIEPPASQGEPHAGRIFADLCDAPGLQAPGRHALLSVYRGHHSTERGGRREFVALRREPRSVADESPALRL